MNKLHAINTRKMVAFPRFSGIRCLMMPYIQGDPSSIPEIYAPYKDIVATVFLKKGDIGFLTIDESLAVQGTPHRGAHAKYDRAIHTEAGKHPRDGAFQWAWGTANRVTLDRDVRILLANNLDGSCAVWNAEHEDTSIDGDIGHVADMYPYSGAVLMRAGEVHEIGILTPHESIPVKRDFDRQFLRIVGSGVHGREEYFTKNPLLSLN
jgi:hypothetical protein